MDNKNADVKYLGFQTPLLLVLIIFSFFIQINYFTSVEYTTHSAIQKYVQFDPKEECIKFAIMEITYVLAVVFFISVRKGYKYFNVSYSIIFIIMHSIYLLWSFLGTVDVTRSDIYMVRMIYLSNVINISIIIYSIFNINKRLRKSI